MNIAPYAVLNEAVNQAKIYIGEKQSKLVNAILRKIVTNKNDCLNFIPEDKCNLPEWLLKSWTSSYGEKNVNEIAKIAMEPPPLDIVVSNKMKESELNQFKINLSGKKILPNVIRCNLKESVESLPGFSDGLWWIQDAASQIPCNLLLSKISNYRKPKSINFNFFLDYVLIYVKYRDGQKIYKLVSCAKIIFYGLDSIKDSNKVYIVEGEMDALSLHEAGIYSVCSVPNGACLLYTSPSPRDKRQSRMPSSA